MDESSAKVGSDPRSPAASDDAVRAVMQGNRGRDTKPELALRSELQRRGLRFRKHMQPLEGLRCRADIVFPTERFAVFMDGCYWHGCPTHGRTPKRNQLYWASKIARNKTRDRRNDVALHAAGWTVLRAWEHEQIAAVADRVEQVVHSLRESASHGARPHGTS